MRSGNAGVRGGDARGKGVVDGERGGWWGEGGRGRNDGELNRKGASKNIHKQYGYASSAYFR